MKSTDLITEHFPDLLFCEVLDRSKQDSICDSICNDDNVKPWIEWFYANQGTFDWLRIMLTNKQYLFFKFLGHSRYLVVLNEKENNAMLISLLRNVGHSTESPGEKKVIPSDTPKKPSAQKQHEDEASMRIQDAVRIQRMIIPRDEDIKKSFKKFFAVHQQQDAVGGDFYWYKETPDCTLVALVDCTGHSVEGAMTSMVCNSLLNQAASSFSKTKFPVFVEHFYEMLAEYNETTDSMLDYGIGAELGVLCFDFKSNELRVISTGVSSFVKTDEGVQLLRTRKIKDFKEIKGQIEEHVLDLGKVSGIYSFTDGVTDQYDSSDEKKLGYKGLQKIIEDEKSFDKDYYAGEINRWKGNNLQYDDLTLLGLAI